MRSCCTLIKVKTMQTYNREKFKVPVTDTFSIFIACRYLLINEKAINENVTIVSEASDHSCIAAFSRINEVFDFIRENRACRYQLYLISGVTDAPANFGLGLLFHSFPKWTNQEK